MSKKAKLVIATLILSSVLTVGGAIMTAVDNQQFSPWGFVMIFGLLLTLIAIGVVKKQARKAGC